MKIKQPVLIAQSIVLCFALLFVESSVAVTQFDEVSTNLGVNFTEGTGGSAAVGFGWIDYDNDGDMDLIIPTNTSHLYKNTLKESGVVGFDEVLFTNSQRSGSSGNIFVGDYDGDGCDDVLIGDSLLRNNTCDTNFSEGVDETFSDVTNAVFGDISPLRVTAAAFGDVDSDGDLDLYIARQGSPKENDLYINTAGQYVRRQINDTRDMGGAWATAFTDYDNDGDLDIFVANDTYICDLFDPTCSAPPSEIYRNTLSESGVLGFEPIGLGIHIAAMGIAIGDYNNDGFLDYYQSDIGHGALTTGNGTDLLALSDTIKLVDPADLNDNRGGWGTAFFDANNDGYVDLFRTNPGVGGVSTSISNELFLNNGDSTFDEVSTQAGLRGMYGQGKGLAYADFNNDGLMDAITGRSTGADLFQNNSTVQNWIKINLKGENPNHRGIGAKIFVHSSSNSNPSLVNKQMREIHAGSSFLSTNDYRAHFGLGADDIVNSVRVVWPSGCSQSVNVSGLNQIIDIDESSCTNIYGRVTTTSGDPIDNLTITSAIMSGVVATTTTECDGSYRIELDPNAYYTQIASSEYTYSPIGDFTLLSAGTNREVNFIATPVLPAITGTVTSNTGSPLEDIVINVAIMQGVVGSPTTDCRGRYRIAVPSNAYYFQPITAGYDYSPFGQFILLNPGQEVTGDFTATQIQ